MIKLIASDLDGTLLHGGEQSLSPRTLSLIRRLTEKGIRFIAASGRQYDNERRLFADIQDHISYIAENGALCAHNGQILFRQLLDDSLRLRIIEEIKKTPNFDILLSRENASVIEGTNPAFVDHIRNVMKNTTEVVDDIAKAEGPFIKIAVANLSDGPQALQNYLQHLQDMFAPEIHAVTSGNIWIDFIPPGINKGTALQTFLDFFGISADECIAMGDQQNDIEMLELAGTSYAVSGAAPGVSDHASHTVPFAEDVLEQLLDELEQPLSGSVLL